MYEYLKTILKENWLSCDWVKPGKFQPETEGLQYQTRFKELKGLAILNNEHIVPKIEGMCVF